MKSQQDLSNTLNQIFQDQQYQSVEPEITQQDHLQIFDSFHPKTKCGKQAFLYCSEQQCRQDALICHPSCKQCSQRHSECIETKICATLHKKIQNQLIQLDSDDKKLIKQMQNKTDQMINSIFDMNQSLKKQFSLFGLNQTDSLITYELFRHYEVQESSQNKNELIQILQDSLSNKLLSQPFCGNFMKRLYGGYADSEKKWFENSLQNLKSIVRKFKKNIFNYFQQIQQCILKLHIKNSKTVSLINYFSNSKVIKDTQQQPITSLFSQNYTFNIQRYLSSIELQKSSFQKIYSFYSPIDQKVIFEKNKFVKVIEDKNDLLFLFQNRQRKNFGFFTPLKFNVSNNGWIQDQKKQTIVFSLDYNCCEKMKYPTHSLKYNFKESRLSIGGIPDNITQKINFIQMRLQQNLQALKDLGAQQSKPGNLFGNSTINFKDLNGFQSSITTKNQKIQRFQIYQVIRWPTKRIL